MPDNTIDGTPDAVKVACPVWSGGKSGDYFKGLPITIGGNAALHGADRLHLLRGPDKRTELCHAGRNAERYGSTRGRRELQKCG